VSTGLLILLVVLAVGAGALVGNLANRQLEESRDRRGNRSPADKARGAARGAVVRLWRWNRDRKRED
jgi:hypothetical protein